MRLRKPGYYFRNYIPYFYQVELWVKKQVLILIKKNYERKKH
jgi:hypothetical protein